MIPMKIKFNNMVSVFEYQVVQYLNKINIDL